MIQRLVEESYFRGEGAAAFWLCELRTPELLIAVASTHPERARQTRRPAAEAALTGDPDAVAAALMSEESEERQRDRLWWRPLRAELEQLRRAKSKSPGGDGLQ